MAFAVHDNAGQILRVELEHRFDNRLASSTDSRKYPVFFSTLTPTDGEEKRRTRGAKTDGFNDIARQFADKSRGAVVSFAFRATFVFLPGLDKVFSLARVIPT